jgi:hypothetical protein
MRDLNSRNSVPGCSKLLFKISTESQLNQGAYLKVRGWLVVDLSLQQDFHELPEFLLRERKVVAAMLL